MSDAILVFASVGIRIEQRVGWLRTGVHVRRLIGSKDLGSATEQCDMGRETPVVQGYSQGAAPSSGMSH